MQNLGTSLTGSRAQVESATCAAAIKDFPVFDRYPELVYLDSASTTQKPKSVLDAITYYYETSNANAHRGVYKLGELSSLAYEDARQKIARHLSTKDSEIVFTSGTTESINIVAHSYLKPLLKAGDTIILGGAEHHANVVPWQQVATEKGATIHYINVHDDGTLDLNHYNELLELNPKIVSVVHISNVLGSINPIEEIIAYAKAKEVPILIDGAQSIGHVKLNLKNLNCDFFVCSAHKAYGPMGTGMLFVKEELHDKIRPYNTGGGMIDEVGLQSSSFQGMPQVLEAGTQNVAGAFSFSVALDYLTSLGFDEIARYETSLSEFAYEEMSKISGVKILGPKVNRSPLISFTIDGIHPHDIASLLSEKNVAVRAGHHCSQHTMNRFGINASVRASFGLYNSFEDITRLIDAIYYAKKVFKIS